MNELEKALEQKMKETTQYISVSELPETVKAKLVKYIFKQDKRGKECLFLTLETVDGKLIVQKYTPTTWEPLYSAMSKIGFDTLEKEFVVWRKQNFGKTIQPRLYPTVKGAK